MMNVDQENVLSLIVDSFIEIASEWDIQIEDPVKSDTKIWGGDSGLSSMNIVNLIIRIEENIADKFDRQITIADERAMSATNSPFRTVGTLSNYLSALLAE
jgi:acyl carrier protein